MTSIMDLGENGIDPHAEVKKLQDLVKKLETQNEVLRSKQKIVSVGDSTFNENDVLKPAVNNSVFYNTRKQSEKKDSTSSDIDSIELIDIDQLSINDSEDSWLYQSPRPPTPQQTRVSPYKWVRQDFDHPSPDVQSARKSLKYKLDEAARLSRSSSTPAFQNYSTPPRANPVSMSLSADSTPSQQSGSQGSSPGGPRSLSGGQGIPGMAPGLASRLQGGRKLNTGTFTRPKKTKPPPPQETSGDDMKENVDSMPHPNLGDLEGIHHPNVTDIENLAKQQEESLRQSIAQTSPRRGFKSRPLPNISNNTDHDSASSNGSNRSSPARYEEGMNRRNSHNSNASLGSDQSSPPDSPYGSSQQLHQPNIRGSLPNVSRLVPRAQHHNSDSSLADYQPDEYSLQQSEQPRYNNSRLQQTQPRPSSPSVSGLKQPSRAIPRGSSPQRTGLPQPRRSIPRPGSANTTRSSGVPTPRRISGLPAPNSRTKYSNQGQGQGPGQQRMDNSWREGCF